MQRPLLSRVIRIVIATSLIIGSSLVKISGQAADRAPVDAPDVPGGWLIQIATTGGFASAGASTMTITSTGAVTCVGPLPQCRGTIESRELTALSQLILQPWPSFGALPRSRCFDCSRTGMIVKVRDQDGLQHQHAILWDLSTQLVLPQEICQLFDEAIALARQERRSGVGDR
jgi:hypothetical protein